MGILAWKHHHPLQILLSFNCKTPTSFSTVAETQPLSLHILFKFLILYFYFQFLALCPHTVQRRRLTGGQTRLKGKPSLLWHAPSSHRVGKQQLVILAVILQASCPYPFAGLRGLTSRLPLLTIGWLALDCPDRSVLSGLGAVQVGLSPGRNATGTWATLRKQSLPRAPFPICHFSSNFPNTAMVSLWLTLCLFSTGRTSCPQAKSQQKSDPRIQMLGLIQI